MAKPQTPQPPPETLSGLLVRKGADKRYYVERITVEGEKVTGRKVVADNFTFEGLALDGTVRFRQLLGEVFDPLVKR